jgi:hypothetical protein
MTKWLIMWSLTALFGAVIFSCARGLRANTPTKVKATGSRRHFAWELRTNATTSQLWQVWTDVPQWPRWDTELESASLQGDFITGSQGALKAKGSPASTFYLEDVVPEQRYRVVTVLPLGGKLIIERALVVDGEAIRFTHEVYFEGAFGRFLAIFVGNKYREALPLVMESIRTLAEAKP